MNHHLLNINIKDHPTNRNITVFFYTEVTHSDYYKTLLKENNISFEYQYDEEGEKHYFGINKVNNKLAKKLNYLVFAKYRKPFIPSSTGKLLLIGITLFFIILAVTGYIITS